MRRFIGLVGSALVLTSSMAAAAEGQSQFDMREWIVPETSALVTVPEHSEHAVATPKRVGPEKLQPVWSVQGPSTYRPGTWIDTSYRKDPRLILSQVVRFDFDLSESASTNAAALVAAQVAGQGVTYLVVGHADERGTDAYNLALSKRRAEGVKRALEAAGVPAKSIEARWYGKRLPVSFADQSLNRRVEILVSGDRPAQLRRGAKAVGTTPRSYPGLAESPSGQPQPSPRTISPGSAACQVPGAQVVGGRIVPASKNKECNQ